MSDDPCSDPFHTGEDVLPVVGHWAGFGYRVCDDCFNRPDLNIGGLDEQARDKGTA